MYALLAKGPLNGLRQDVGDTPPGILEFALAAGEWPKPATENEPQHQYGYDDIPERYAIYVHQPA